MQQIVRVPCMRYSRKTSPQPRTPTVRATAAPLAALLLLLPLLAEADAASGAPRLESAIRTLTLEAAARQGHAPPADPARRELRRDPTLADIARGHSRAMFEADTLAHHLNGAGPAERVARRHRTLFGLVAENVAVQKRWPKGRDLAASLVDGWMNSPGHRKNILAPYEVLEVGCFGDSRTMYCTQLFVGSAAWLADGVAFEQRPGTRVTVALAGEATARRRIGIAPVNARQREHAAPVEGGAATLAVPPARGLFQLELWTEREDEPRRYRIIGGPYIRVTP